MTAKSHPLNERSTSNGDYPFPLKKGAAMFSNTANERDEPNGLVRTPVALETHFNAHRSSVKSRYYPKLSNKSDQHRTTDTLHSLATTQSPFKHEKRDPKPCQTKP